MSCTIKYKNKKYSEKEFKEYFINNKNEFITFINKNKNVIEPFINNNNQKNPNIQNINEPKIGDIITIESNSKKNNKIIKTKVKILKLEKVYQDTTTTKDNEDNTIKEENGIPMYFATLEKLDGSKKYEIIVGEDGRNIQILDEKSKNYRNSDSYINAFNFTKEKSSLDVKFYNFKKINLEITKHVKKEIAENIPSLLHLKNIPYNLQELIIGNLTSKISESYIKGEKYPLRFFKEYYEKLLDYKKLYEESNNTVAENNLFVIDNILNQYAKIKQIVIQELTFKNNIKIDNDKLIKFLENLEEEEEEEENSNVLNLEEKETRQLWDDFSIFREDYRKKININILNLLENTKNVKSITLKYIKNDTIISKTAYNRLKKYEKIYYKSFYSIEYYKPILSNDILVPVDVILNDVVAIIAESNDSEYYFRNKNFENLMYILEQNIPHKPYLIEVIKKLRHSPASFKNAFVKSLSYYYNEHLSGFKKNFKGNPVIYFGKPDIFSTVNAVLKEWFLNLKKTKLIDSKTLEINKKEVEKLEILKEKITEGLSKQEDVKKLFTTFLNSLGIILKEDVIGDIIENGILVRNKSINLFRLLNENNQVFYEYLRLLKDTKDLQDYTLFTSFSALKYFAKGLANKMPSFFPHSYKSSDNKTYFAFSKISYFIQRLQDLNNDKALIEQLSLEPFSSDSYYLDGLKNGMKLQYFTIDGYVDGYGRKFEKLTKDEQEQYKWFLFKKDLKNSKNYSLNMFLPTTSNKKIQRGLKVEGLNFLKYLKDDHTLTLEGKNILFQQFFLPEYKRIVDFQNNKEKYNYKGISEAGNSFLLFPELNLIKDLFNEDGFINDNINEKSKYFEEVVKVIEKSLFDVSNIRLENFRKKGYLKEVHKIEIINNKRYEIITDAISFSKHAEIFDGNAEDKTDALNEIINYEFNYMLMNLNVMQLFQKDIAYRFKSKQWEKVKEKIKNQNPNIVIDNRNDALKYYEKEDFLQEHIDTFNNYGKRLASLVAHGTSQNITPLNEKINVVVINDLEIISAFKNYQESLGLMNTTDGAEIGTFKEFLKQEIAEGNIDELQYQTLLQKEKYGKLKDVKISPKKFVFNGVIKHNNTERLGYIKSSTSYLVNQNVKNKKIALIYEAMELAGVDKIIFESAFKEGQPKTLVNVNNITDVNELKILFENNKIELERRYLRKQVELPLKDKNNIIPPTQAVEILSNIFYHYKELNINGKVMSGKEFHKQVVNTYVELFNELKENLYRELEYNPITKKLKNLDTLRELIIQAGIKNKFSVNDFASLDIENDNFKIPLWQSAVSEKIEPVLNSIITSRLVKILMYGNENVQVPAYSLTPILSSEELQESDIVDDITWVSGYNFDGILKPSRIENGIVKPNEIIVSQFWTDNRGTLVNLAKFIGEDGKLDAAKIPDSILEGIISRTPTQSPSSIGYSKIVGFLPSYIKKTIYAPPELIFKMGADFDFDKLIGIFKSILIKENSIEVDRISNINSIKNKLHSLFLSLVKNINVQKDFETLLSTGKLESLSNIFGNENIKNYGLSEGYQNFKFNKAKQGNTGINIFSANSRTILNLISSESNDDFEFSIIKRTTISLSSALTKSGKHKSEINSYFQSASVDDENLQILSTLGITKDTMGVITYLINRGYEEDTIIYFINQPIIKKYLESDLKGKEEFKEQLKDIKKYKFLNLTNEILLNNILKTDNQTSQNEILKLFLKLETQNEKLVSLSSSSNTFSKGLGKNMLFVKDKANKILENIKIFPKYFGEVFDIQEEEYETDVLFTQEEKKRIIEEKIEQGFYQLSDNILLKPTTLPGLFALPNFISLDMFSKFFIINDKKFQAISNFIIANSNLNSYNTVYDVNRLTKIIQKELLKYLTYTSIENIEDEIQHLLYDTEDNMSIGSIIKDLQNNKISNYFLNKIIPEISEEIKNAPVYLKFPSSVEDSDERKIHNIIYQMLLDDRVIGNYNGKEYTNSMLIKDIFKYALLSKNTHNFSNFERLIPINFLYYTGFYKTVQQNFKNINPVRFTIQFFQTFPKYANKNEKKPTYFLNLESDDKESKLLYTTNSKEYIELPTFYNSLFPIYNDSVDIITKYKNEVSNNENEKYDSENYNGYDDFEIINSTANIEEKIEITEQIIENKKEEIKKLEIEFENPIYNANNINFIEHFELNLITEKDNILNLIEQLAAENTDSLTKVFVDSVIKNIQLLNGYKIILSSTVNAKGEHDGKNKIIYINPSYIKNVEDFKKTILEEILHALIYTGVANNTNTGELIKLFDAAKLAMIEHFKTLNRDFNKELEIVKEKIKNGKGITTEESELIYPFTDLFEFTGRLFKSEKIINIIKDKTIENKNILNKLYDFIFNLLESLGLNLKNNSLLTASIVEILNFIEAANIKKQTKTDKNIKELLAELKDSNSQDKLYTSEQADKIIDKLNNYKKILKIQKIKIDDKFIIKADYKILKFSILKLNKDEYKIALEEWTKTNGKYESLGVKNTKELYNKLISIFKTGVNKPINTKLKTRAGNNIFRITVDNPSINENEKIENEIIREFNEEEKNEYDNLLEKNNKSPIIYDDGESYKDSENNFDDDFYDFEDEYQKSNNTINNQENEKIYLFFKNFRRRINIVENNINIANSQNDFKKSFELQEQLQRLEERLSSVVQLRYLSDIINEGLGDLKELEILFNSEITSKDSIYIDKILTFWENFKDNVLEDNDLLDENIINHVSEIIDNVYVYRRKLNKINETLMNEVLSKHNVLNSVTEIFQNFQDVNNVNANLFDLTRHGNDFLSVIGEIIRTANIKITEEYLKIKNKNNKLKERVNKILNSLGYNDNDFSIFFKKDSKNRRTPHLVNRFNSSYNKIKYKLINDLNRNGSFSDMKKYVSFLEESDVFVDLDKLFRSDKSEKYLENLKKQYGEKNVEEYYEIQKKLIDKYNTRLSSYKKWLTEKFNLSNESQILQNEFTKNLISNFVEQNSPFLIESFKNREESFVKNEKYRNHNYFVTLPKNVTDYDVNFKIIENNEVLLETYNHYKKLEEQLSMMLPESERRKMKYNGIPYLRDKGINSFKNGLMKFSFSSLNNIYKKAIRAEKEKIIINESTGEKENKLKISVTSNNYDIINTVKIKLTQEYIKQTGEKPSEQLLKEWEEDILFDLAKDQSFDLFNVLDSFSLEVLKYHNIAKIEDVVLLAQKVLNEQREMKENSILNDTASFKNIKKLLEYNINILYNSRNDKSLTNTIIYSNEELEEKENLEKTLETLEENFKNNKIDKTEYDSQKEQLQSHIDTLGQYKDWNKVGDVILKWVQLKVMGWNAMSGVANMSFGFVGNYIEASRDLHFSIKELMSAYAFMKENILRNASFNSAYKENIKANKIRNIIESGGYLANPAEELYSNDINFSGKYKFLSAFNITERTEFINQAPIIIAMLKRNKIIVNGNEITYYEAINEDGMWDEEKYGKEPDSYKEFQNKIKQVVFKIHGAYDSVLPLMAKKQLLGRALLQFRTFLIENIATRFEFGAVDRILGEYRKGRYISFFDFINSKGVSSVFSISKGLLKSASFGFLFKNFSFDDELKNSEIKTPFSIFYKNALNKITFNRVFKNFNKEKEIKKFNDIVKDVNYKKEDAANMRAMMVELISIVSLYSAYFMLSSFIKGLDDDDDKFLKFTLLHLVNQGVRVKTDMISYINPNEAYRVIRNPLPAGIILDDVLQFLNAGYKMMQNEDEIKAGIYAGNSRLFRETAQLFPFSSQIYKTFSYGISDFAGFRN